MALRHTIIILKVACYHPQGSYPDAICALDEAHEEEEDGQEGQVREEVQQTDTVARGPFPTPQ